MPAERIDDAPGARSASVEAAGVSGLNEIARRIGVAPSTVRETLKRFGACRV